MGSFWRVTAAFFVALTLHNSLQRVLAGKGKKDWTAYLEKIKQAVENYRDCSGKDSGCYRHVLDSDLGPWRERGGIEKKVFDEAKSNKRNGVVHYQIIKGKVYRDKDCLFPFRCDGIEYFLKKLGPRLPDMELLINTHDYPMSPKWTNPAPYFSFSRTPNEVDIMYPTWAFWTGGPFLSIYPDGIGKWDEQRRIISKTADEWPWAKKKSKAFFRGSRTSGERDPLILFSRKHPSYADAAYTKNQAWKSDKDTLGAAPVKEVKFEDHCKFKYLFNFRGVAASFRFRHLFLCRSLVFHVGEEWIEFFYPALKPWVHYIPVDTKMTDLDEMLEFVRKNDKVAQEIAERGYNFVWKHLRIHDVEHYWKNLLVEYAKLMKWTPARDNSLVAVKLKQ